MFCRVARLLPSVSLVWIDALKPELEGAVDFTMPERSRHKKAFAPVAAGAVVMVTVPASLLTATDPMVGAPVAGPFKSALQKLKVPAVTAAALVKVKPEGKVKTICPVEGTDVLAKNST